MTCDARRERPFKPAGSIFLLAFRTVSRDSLPRFRWPADQRIASEQNVSREKATLNQIDKTNRLLYFLSASKRLLPVTPRPGNARGQRKESY